MKKLYSLLLIGIILVLVGVHTGDADYDNSSSPESNSSAVLVHALTSYYNGDIPTAIGDMQNITNPDDSTRYIYTYFLLQQALLDQNQGDVGGIDAAIQNYRTILNNQPDQDIEQIAKLGLSICKIKTRSSDYILLVLFVVSAIPVFSLIGVKKYLIASTITRSKKMRSEKNYNAAIADLETIVKEYPERTNLYKDMSEIALEAGMTDTRAMDIYEKAIQHGDENPAILMLLSKSYAKVLRYDDQAKSVYQQALQTEQIGPEKKINLMRDIAKAAMSKMVISDAVNYYAALYKQYQNDYDIIYNLAYLYVKKDNYNEQTEELIIKAMHMHAPVNNDDSIWTLITYLGEKYMRANMLDTTAVGIYENILSHDPGNKQIINVLVTAYLSQNQYDKVIIVLSNALTLYPRDIDMYSTLADAYRAEKLYDNAIETAIKGIQLDNTNLKLLTALCDAYIAANKYDNDAIVAFEDALNLLPKDSNDREGITSALAMAYFAKSNKDERAIEVYELALKSHRDEELLKFLAQYYLDKQELEKAGIKFIELLRLSRSNPEIDYKLASIMAQLDEENNNHDSNEAADVSLPNREQVNNLIQFYEQTTNESVTRLYERAFEIQPSDVRVASILYIQYKKKNVTDESAIKVYNTLLNSKDDPDLRFELAGLYAENKKVDEAKKEYIKLLSKVPGNYEARQQLANIAVSSGDVDMAISQLEELYNHEPDNRQTIITLAGLYVSKQMTEPKTLNIYSKAIGIDSKNKSLYVIFASALFKAGHYQKSSDTLMQLVAMDSVTIPDVIQMHKSIEAVGQQSVEFYLNFAELYVRAKAIDEAVTYYKKSYNISPDKSALYIGRLEKLYAQYPKNKSVMKLLFNIYMANKKYDKAAVLGEEVLKLTPDDSSMNRTMATVYETIAENASDLSSDYTSLLDNALKHDPNNADIIAKLEKAYRRQLQQKPDDIENRMIYSALLINNKRINDAITELQKAKEYAKEQKKTDLERTIGLKLGNLLVTVDMKELAIDVFQDLLKRQEVGNENIEAFYNLAMMYEQTDNIQKAKDIYKRIVNFRFNYRDAATRLKAMTTGSYSRSAPASSPGDPKIQSQINASPTATTTQTNTNSIVENRELPPNYTFIKKLGEGGMGIVYLIRNEKLKRLEAIKYIKERDYARDPQELIRRFIKEARLAARLNHENIVTIYDVNEEKKYILMEYVEGKSVMKLLQKEEKVDYWDAAKIGYKVADGLFYAHNKGVFHRDISPDNILVDNGYDTVKIVDFGVARLSSELSESATNTKVVGKLLYMSPEQQKGNSELDGRTDIYALGVTIYQMLTGVLPFYSENIDKKYTDIPKSPAEISPHVPKKLSDIVIKCLQPKKENRYENAKQLSELLQPFAGTIIDNEEYKGQ